MRDAVHEGTIRVAAAGVYHQAGGLVDDQHIRIPVDHIQRHGLGFERRALGRGLQADLQTVVAAHGDRLLAYGTAIQRHVTGLNQLLHIAA
jgi:hypothetical protein